MAFIPAFDVFFELWAESLEWSLEEEVIALITTETDGGD